MYNKLSTLTVMSFLVVSFILTLPCNTSSASPSSSSSSSSLSSVIMKPRRPKGVKVTHQKFYDSVNANIISAAMLSSAGAFNKYSSSSSSSSSFHRPSNHFFTQPSSAATQSIIQQLFGSSFLSPASTAISSIASNVVSSLRPGKHSSSISSSLSNNRPTTTSRLMRAAFKEAFAYLAAPFFMPIAVGRAMVQPPGLNDQNQIVKRFARFLIKEFVLKGTEAEKEFQDQFLQLLTKDRKNILLTMKQFRDSVKEHDHKESTDKTDAFF